MIKNDYILDMVETLGKALGKLVFDVKEEGEVQEIGNLSDKDIIIIILKKFIEDGNYNDGEDALFEFLNNEEDMTMDEVKEIGQWFYKELEAKSDKELLHGNFSRDEIHEGLKDFLHQVDKKALSH